MASPNVARLLETYDAFVHGRLDKIPVLFDPDGFYSSSGMFVGIDEVYRGHQRIAEMWYASTEAWETLNIEAGRIEERGDCVVAEAHFSGIGAESGLEVDFTMAHLVRYRDGLIVEFAGFPGLDEALAALEASG
jgi:ketosteroid isomerase-like protein